MPFINELLLFDCLFRNGLVRSEMRSEISNSRPLLAFWGIFLIDSRNPSGCQSQEIQQGGGEIFWLFSFTISLSSAIFLFTTLESYLQQQINKDSHVQSSPRLCIASLLTPLFFYSSKNTPCMHLLYVCTSWHLVYALIVCCTSWHLEIVHSIV